MKAKPSNQSRLCDQPANTSLNKIAASERPSVTRSHRSSLSHFDHNKTSRTKYFVTALFESRVLLRAKIFNNNRSTAVCAATGIGHARCWSKTSNVKRQVNSWLWQVLFAAKASNYFCYNCF